MFNLYPFRLYLKHTPNAIMSSISIISNIMVWAWLLWNIRPQDESLFLHYNILFGVDLIGSWGQIFYIPLVGAIIFVVNFLLGWFLFKKTELPAYLLLAMSILCQIFLGITASLVVFLNV